MHLVCPECGALQRDPPVEGDAVVCPECSGREPILRLPLFLVAGPSGAGKTTAVRTLRRLDGILLLDADLLWGLGVDFDRPDAGYHDFHDLCLMTAFHLGQNGLPLAVFGATTPEDNESLPARQLFTEIHYLALTCDEDELRRRLRARPSWRRSSGTKFIEATCAYNRWLQENGDRTDPPMTVLDTTTAEPEETAARVRGWLADRVP